MPTSSATTEAWNSFPTAKGRQDDYNKALDVLPRPDSPHYVAANHKLLQDVETELRMRQLDAAKKIFPILDIMNRQSFQAFL